MQFKTWFEKHELKLEKQYSSYVDNLNKKIFSPVAFDEFVQDSFDLFDGYTER